MDSGQLKINPEKLSSQKLKLFFKHLASAAQKAEEKYKAKKAVDKQITKLKDISSQPGFVSKTELAKAIERLEQKMNEILEMQKPKQKKKEIKTEIVNDIFQKIDSLSVKINALSNLVEKSKKENKEMDTKRIYELEQKIAKKLDKMTFKPSKERALKH